MNDSIVQNCNEAQTAGKGSGMGAGLEIPMDKAKGVDAGQGVCQLGRDALHHRVPHGAPAANGGGGNGETSKRGNERRESEGSYSLHESWLQSNR